MEMFTFFMLIIIPTAMYFAIVTMAKTHTAARIEQRRIQRAEEAEELRQLKW